MNICKVKDMINNTFRREHRETALHQSSLSLTKLAVEWGGHIFLRHADNVVGPILAQGAHSVQMIM